MNTMSVVDYLPPSVRVAKRALVSWYGGEPELRLLPVLCRPDRITLDVGANHGIYAWHALKWSKEVVLFEPQPELAQFLRSAFGAKARVEEVALSDAEGTAVLRVPTDPMLGGCATVEGTNGLDAVATVDYRVPVRPLDGYAFAPVGFVKLDVEGHELAVLRGARALIERDRPTIMLEAEERHRPGALDSVAYFLRAAGYRGYYLEDRALRPIDGLATADGSVGGSATARGLFNFVFLSGETHGGALAGMIADGPR